MSNLAEQAKSIFLEAIDKHAPEQWPAFLEQACAGDAVLRAGVEKLLRAQAEIGSFHEETRVPVAATVDESLNERPGTVIGPYKLLQQIGEGGMGTVFMAEQQHPVRRKVALKVIKPGMDTRQVIARFEAERQALAMMDHLNIARVLDVGATDSGRPYFVMELVHGVPITKYCDDNQLTPRQRLELFVPVCQAIQHAHQKGIIHRDIKPSNILVTLYDGKPVPKVIDFGVAKATEQPLTERTLFTQYGTIVGTLEYMSPEQAEMSALGVDTRSDIYSLGVLLYELLTGSTPLERPRLREAAYADVLRLIREEAAPRPSARLSSSDTLPAIAAARKTEPAKLARLVRGELDWIVMKALEKDRVRRYETANGFAADVQRYLDDEPVRACPPSAWYQFRKFARRNKVILTTTTVVAAALMTTAIALAISNARIRQEVQRAGQEVQRADAEKARAGKNLKLAMDSLDELYTDLAERGLAEEPHLEPLRHKYLERALVFYRKFATENSADPAVGLETAKAESRLAHILYLLGNRAEAEKAFQQAIARFEELGSDAAAGEDVRKALAPCLFNFAALLRHTRRPKLAEQTYQRAREIWADLAARFPSEPRYRQSQASTYHNLAGVFDDMRRLAEAEKAARQGLDFLRELVKEYPKVTDYRSDLSLGLSTLGNILRHSKRVKEAEDALGEAAEIQAAVIKSFPNVPQFRWHLSLIYGHQATLLASAGRLKEAELPYRQALQLQSSLAANFPATAVYRKTLSETCGLLGRLLSETGRAKEGLALHERLVKDFPTDPEYQHGLAGNLSDLGLRLSFSGRPEDAENALLRALSLQEKLVKDYPHEPAYRRRWAAILSNYGTMLALTGRRPDAEKCLRQALAVQKELWTKFSAELAYQRIARDETLPATPGTHAYILADTPDYRGELALGYWNLARLLQESDRLQEVEVYREGLKTVPDSPHLNNGLAWMLATSPDPKFRDPGQAVQLAKRAVDVAPKEGNYWNSLGVAHYRVGDWKSAVLALEKSTELRKGGDANDWFFLAMAHWKLDQKEMACKWNDRAVAWMDKNQEALKKNRPLWEELSRFRAEAAELLEIKKN